MSAVILPNENCDSACMNQVRGLFAQNVGNLTIKALISVGAPWFGGASGGTSPFPESGIFNQKLPRNKYQKNQNKIANHSPQSVLQDYDQLETQ